MPLAVSTPTILSAGPRPLIAHLFTVDVEEYLQVSACEAYLPRERWDDFESRVALGVDRLLDPRARLSARASFCQSRSIVRAISPVSLAAPSAGTGRAGAGGN